MVKISKKRIWLSLGIATILGLLVLVFGAGLKRVNWSETYEADSRQPYGTHVLLELLKTYFPGQTLLLMRDSLVFPPGKDGTTANYVFVGAGQLLDSSGVEKLLDFVASGNRAFISSRSIPFSLMERLLPKLDCNGEYVYWEDYPEQEDTAVTCSTLQPGLVPGERFPMYYWRGGVRRPYRWQYIDSIYSCNPDSGTVAAGFLNDSLMNFARIRHGEGFFFLHTSPIAFSNIQLVDQQSLQYAEQVFSQLPAGPIYWDEYSKVSEDIARRQNMPPDGEPEERRLNSRSPLQYVLEQPSLTWAWYLLLTLALLYLIFRARRRQRIIPVLEPNANTSLEFVRTIGRLYFLQNEHRLLALQQMRLFRAYVWQRYGLQARETDEEFIEKLSGKSEIQATRLQDLLDSYRQIERSERIDAGHLTGFHRKLDYFYKNCR